MDAYQSLQFSEELLRTRWICQPSCPQLVVNYDCQHDNLYEQKDSMFITKLDRIIWR
jgi:hypothetical protein